MSEPKDALVDDLYDAMETHRAVGVGRVERIAADLRARGWSQDDSLDVERLARALDAGGAEACTCGGECDPDVLGWEKCCVGSLAAAYIRAASHAALAPGADR